MQPSEKYAVDYTDGYGLKWSKQLSQIYTTLGDIDISAAISSFNDPLVKNVYRKSKTYNPIYDNSITYASVGHDSLVMKYFARNDYPTEEITSGTVIIDHASPDGLSYATGVNEDASVPYNGGMGSSRVLVDAEYNKMLFKVTLREMTLNTSDTPIANISYSDPTYTDVELKDIDDDKWYALFYHGGAKVWNGSSWSDSNLAPVLICNGGSTQSFQGGGSSFNNLFNNYNGTMGSGQNIEFSNVASNYYWTAHNFVNRMNIENYALGWSDTYDYKPSYADNFDAMKAFMLGYLTDNNYGPWQTVYFQLCREIHKISDDMSILLTVICSAQLDGSNNLYVNFDNIFTFPIIKGSSVSKFLAGHGLYYLTDSSADLTGITPDTLHNSSAIWVGEMSADGTTTGNWIKGADIENYTGYNKDGNIVNPDFDPSGGGGSDDDDPWHGVDFGGTGAGGGGAFCSVYYMTGAELTSLKSWGMTSAPEGFDMLPSIIGLHQVPVALSGISTTVKFLKSAAITQSGDSRLVDTGVSAGTGTGAPIDFSLGSVNINRRMKQRGEPYLDYDCTVELYLPFAGIFQLDTQAVMGRTISAKITLDPVNGTVFAYAWVENGGEKMPIAYGGGPIAVSLPVSSNQWGLSRAAAQQMKHQQIQNVLNIAKDAVLSWAGGKMAQNINRMGFSTNVDAQIAQYGTTQGLKYQSVQQGSNIIESTANTVQGIHNLVQLNNTNYTAVNGSFGGSYAEWSQPFTAYVRITRPKFQKPSNYSHTQAVPCVETKTVGSCAGLVQCINPDIDSIPCTQTEKVLITNALVNGVYAGGGGQ